MFKTFAYGSIVAAALLVTATAGQAREISVWGNNFTVDDGQAAVAVPPAPRFGATVIHPERYLRTHRRLDSLN